MSLEELHGVGDEMKLGVRAGANSLSELEGKIAAVLVETDVLNHRQAFSLVHQSTFEEHELVVDLPVPGHAVVGIEIADNVERRVPGLINSQGEINGLDPVQLGLGKMNPEGLIRAVEANDVIAVRNQIGLSFRWCQTKTNGSRKIGHLAPVMPQKARATRQGQLSD